MDNPSQLVQAGWLFAGLAALAYGLIWCWRGGHGWLRSAVKTLAVAALAGIGAAQGAPGLVVAGLALGAVGDLALSRAGTRAFLIGMAAFAVGHLAYAGAFLSQGLPAPDGVRGLAMLALLALTLSTRWWLLPRTGALAPAVASYVTVICLMGLAALTLPAGLSMLGAGLFILSDVLLAVVLFLCPRPAIKAALSGVLWPAYWLGQACILQGALAAPA